MGFEIEIKAWADDPEGIGRLVSRFANYEGEFLREDAYWFRGESAAAKTAGIPVTDIRIRNECCTDPQGRLRRTVWVTCKTKEVRERVEVNDEREFEVSDGDVFAEFLARLGFERGQTKTKQGRVWTWEGITAELTEVRDLGWFVELEIMADNDRPETVAAARSRLLNLLGKLGIGEEKIESRYYRELLNLKG
ncbi:MAG: class IV adenylate cyclase [Spirochaetaceae bacterium]|nr:class IV adenylate cyclase [Spirochaetaceae bacterium]